MKNPILIFIFCVVTVFSTTKVTAQSIQLTNDMACPISYTLTWTDCSGSSVTTALSVLTKAMGSIIVSSPSPGMYVNSVYGDVPGGGVATFSTGFCAGVPSGTTLNVGHCGPKTSYGYYNNIPTPMYDQQLIFHN